jgi:alpha-1,2-mannosyltransferase
VGVAATGGALAVLGASAAVVLYQHNPGWMFDARIYRDVGAALLQGHDVYHSVNVGFLYPPFATILFTPLAFLSVKAMGFILTAITIVALEVAVWLSLGRPPIARDTRWLLLVMAICAVAAWLDPLRSTLLLGQVNAVLLLLVLGDLSLPDTNRWKGLGVGLAAGIKLTPALFIVYLVLTRRLRAAGVALATLAATIGIGFLVMPATAVSYWDGAFLDSSRIGYVQDLNSQSLRSILVRWAHTSNVEALWIVLAVVVAAAGLGLAVWASRRGQELLAVSVCGLVTLMVSPITWPHHWVWILPLSLWLARQAWDRRSLALLTATAAIVVEFLVRPYRLGIAVDPVNPVADLHLGLRQLLLTSTYAATAIAVLVALAFQAARSRTSSGDLLMLQPVRGREEHGPGRTAQ